MKKDKNKAINIIQQTNVLKSQGVSISRREIGRDSYRAYKENESLIIEASREQSVLRMKRFYERKGWDWPPKTMNNTTTVHLINNYYGKEVCKHTPKDELEEKMS